MKTIHDFARAKKEGCKISMLTCYDSTFATLLKDSPIDTILVGDSAAMTQHGHSSTLPISVEQMAVHVQAVSRVIGNEKFIVGDMPFLSYRKGLVSCMDAVEKLMKAGAHAVKLEGLLGHEELVSHIVSSGVPVMGHLGLTPQSFYQMGGYKVQGKDPEGANLITEQALKLEELGAFSLVLECVPNSLAQKLTQKLSIPTIGIGAGAAVDGQVLVLQDMLGLNALTPRFVRRYASCASLVKESVAQFVEDVQGASFPDDKESYGS